MQAHGCKPQLSGPLTTRVPSPAVQRLPSRRLRGAARKATNPPTSRPPPNYFFFLAEAAKSEAEGAVHRAEGLVDRATHAVSGELAGPWMYFQVQTGSHAVSGTQGSPSV